MDHSTSLVAGAAMLTLASVTQKGDEAIPELPSRIDGEIIQAEHMNAATIRSVQRYTSAAQRDSLNPAPEEGQPAWLSDVNHLTVWTGTEWIVAGIGVFLQLDGSSPMIGNLVINASGIIYQGIQGANAVGFKWQSPRVVARIDDNVSVTLASLVDLDSYLPLSGGTLTGDLNLPTNTLASKDAQFGSGQEILMLEDGSAVFGNGALITEIKIQDANSAVLYFDRPNVPTQWRFRIDPNADLSLESSQDGSSWQVEDTWSRA